MTRTCTSITKYLGCRQIRNYYAEQIIITLEMTDTITNCTVSLPHV